MSLFLLGWFCLGAFLYGIKLGMFLQKLEEKYRGEIK